MKCSATDVATLGMSNIKRLPREKIIECMNQCKTSNRNTNSRILGPCEFECMERDMPEIQRVSEDCGLCFWEIELCIRTSNRCEYSCSFATLDTVKCKECAEKSGCFIGKCINPNYLP